MTNFKTIADGEIFSAVYEINRSKFLAHVQHVTAECEARNFLQLIRKKYFDATHNCSAWILGEYGDKQKSNDDGEPSGTAGNPILETIKNFSVTNCAIIVTRYFGGIKLGAGGLIRAYSHASALGLANAKLVQMTAFKEFSLTIDYNFLAVIENYLRVNKIRVSDTNYSDVVSLKLLILPDDVEEFFIKLNELTSANFCYEELGEKLISIDIAE